MFKMVGTDSAFSFIYKIVGGYCWVHEDIHNHK